MSSLFIVLIVFAAVVTGAALALLPAMAHFRREIALLNGRLDQSEQARVKANTQLLEARTQVESLQQELIDSKRHGVVQAASASAKVAAAAVEAKAKQERAKADLMRQLEANDKSSQSPSGFADTQPMGSSFGALAR
jgi:septal ring factor EnvC (AmiA/AmiB activator)